MEGLGRTERRCGRHASQLCAGGEQDLSWLRELDLGDFTGDHAGDRVCVEITYRAEVIEVALSFWVEPTDAGWVVAGPATLW